MKQILVTVFFRIRKLYGGIFSEMFFAKFKWDHDNSNFAYNLIFGDMPVTVFCQKAADLI